jgi:hypothetical protein
MKYDLSATLKTLVATLVLTGLPAAAIQVQGVTYFEHPPRLIKAITTMNGVNVWGATYYFTLELPITAGEPLQRVIIQQAEGFSPISFSPHNITAYVEGDRQKIPLPLGEVQVNSQDRLLSITFAPPVTPGTTVVLQLLPDSNPFTPGVYLFGVTAFPAGEAVHGQFLGYGRLQFYHSR